MWLLNDSISSRTITFKTRKKLNPSHCITTQSAVADPFHCTKRWELNEVHTHTPHRSRQYLLAWDPAQKQRHVQAELSPNLGVMNTKTQEQIPGIRECRKDPPLAKGWQCCHGIPRARFMISQQSQKSVRQLLFFKSQVFPDLGLEASALLDLNNAPHSSSSYVHLKANKRETGYCSEINTLCFANY